MTNMSDNLRGAFLMMGCMIAFTINDAFMKGLSGEVPLFQAIFLRGLATCVVLFILAWRAGAFKISIQRSDWVIVGLRAVAETLGAYFFLSALFNMPFANVSSILQALPLSVTLAGAVFFREPVGWRRMAAIFIGFLGVLLIVQPGGAGFNSYSLYAVLTVIVITFRDLAARRLSSAVPSLTVAFVTAALVTVLAGLASLSETWVPLTATHSWKFAGAVFFVIGGYLFSVMAMRVGEISFIAPFRYTSLVVAIVLGLVAFGERPDLLTLIGAAIVVATGLFTLWRERGIHEPAAHKGLRAR